MDPRSAKRTCGIPAASDTAAPLEGDLDLAADQAIAACGGDARTKVSRGYARGRLPGARERNDEADV
ncbi:hypothetical protein B5V03_23730 [Bradyrhizobium betae]|uniref:Uncharacterized protein n=1 Tax=Bradyrhizobium betae TaxID=244734 RepID=A0A4Q1UVD3_9BRAD|nr:hypothetical protein B5V03_23730 [Bradyrhizobium betae]